MNEEISQCLPRVRWPKRFEQRQSHSYQEEDNFYIEYLAFLRDSLNTDDDEEEADECDEYIEKKDDSDHNGGEPNEGELVFVEEGQEDTGADQIDENDIQCLSEREKIEIFMKGSTGEEDALPYADQVEEVTGVSQEVTIEGIMKPIALLDERSKIEGSGAGGRCRPYLGPLTVDRLQEQLAVKRFTVKSDGNGEGSDAERRVIFITDLNSSSIESLATTASRNQAPPLKDMFYKHLTGEASIGVTIPSQGFLTFALEFHIPHYVLEKSEGLLRDTRRRANGKPVRQSMDLPFLPSYTKPSRSTNSIPRLYETQFSVVVAGIDHWLWTAYGFVDTYYGPKESVEYYDRFDGNTGRPDPLGAGHIASNNPIWTPREYFFKVFEIRMNVVRRRWRQILKELKISVKKPKSLLLLNNPKARKEAREFSEWAFQMVGILSQLVDCLSSNVDAWKEFKRREIKHFEECRTSKLTSLELSIEAVDKAFSDLQGVLQKLVKLKDELEATSPQGVHAYLGFGNQEAAIYQQKSASNIQVLTVITIIFSPLALATAIFSADGVLPFARNPARFVYVVIILSVLVLATLLVLTNGTSWFQQTVKCSTPEASFRDASVSTNDSKTRQNGARSSTFQNALKQIGRKLGIVGDEEDIALGHRTRDDDHG